MYYTLNLNHKLSFCKIIIILVLAYFPQNYNIQSLYCQNKTKSLESQTNNSNSNNTKELEHQYFLKGEEHFFQKHFYTAEIFFKKVIQINPENAYAHSYLGDIYLYNKELDKAIYHYKIASELLSGIKQYNEKNTKEILFLRSIDQNKIDIPVKEYFRLVQAYYLKKNPEESEYYCNLILNKYPEFFQCYYYLSMIELEFRKNRKKTIYFLKKYYEGLNQFIKENKENPTLLKEKEKVEYVLNILSNPKNKELSIDIKKELDPLSLFYQNDNNLIVSKQEEFIENIQNKKPEFILPTEKQFEPIWIDIQYLKNKNKKKAIELLLKYKNSKEPKNAKEQFYIRKSLCYLLFEEKNYQRSEKECLESLQYDFEPEILYYLALSTLKQNKKEEFYQYIKKYIEYKQDINALFLLAYELYMDKKYNEALNYFEKINQIQPNHKESLYYRFLIYKELEQIEFMKDITRKILLFYPEDIEMFRYITYQLLEKKEKQLALDILLKIYKKTHDLKDGLILAGLYIQEDQNQKAFEILSELYQNYPDDFKLIRILILLLKQMNKNYDTIEIIAKRFLQTSQNKDEKEEIIKILPEEIRNKLLTEINTNNEITSENNTNSEENSNNQK
ncbi:MAG: hypothetical protein KatS3mg129_0615 [Leptospiraceae bacterium]|nr:MAG: hypothetical protein KatS3mg129_0615 [Leptospiraceae bacterium]